MLMDLAVEVGKKSAFEMGRKAASKYLLFGLIPMPLIWNIVIICIVAMIFYWLTKSGAKREEPIKILKRRYAEGEIDKETFDQMKKDIAD